MNAPITLVAAYAFDRAFGEPPNALHPVAWMGRAIEVGRDWTLRAGKLGQLWRGAAVALAIPIVAAATAYGAVRALDRLPVAGALAAALLVKPMFAVRALRDAAYRVRDALDADDLSRARRALRSLCSRAPDDLDRDELVAATIESVAENASDSIVAPFLFFACFGVPGVVFYRAVNTLDAMVGYRGALEHAGKVAARADDLLNLLPARLTALLLLLAGAAAAANVGRGLAMLLRDGGRTESPNAGRPMAAMAGLLGVRLVKPGHYALGDASCALDTAGITTAWRIVSIASVAALVLCAVVAGAIHG